MTTDLNKVALWEIAKALGATYEQSYADDEKRGVFTMPGGVKFFAVMDGYQNVGKIRFSPVFPSVQAREDGTMTTMSQKTFDYNGPVFDGIKVSATKTPEQIARDIERRFLPTVNELQVKALAYVERQAAYFKNKNEIAAIATEAFKPFGYNSKRGFTAEITYISESYVRVKLDDLNADKVQKLAAFLETL